MARKRKSKLIESTAQLRAVGGPMRHRVLRTLAALGPSTVAELADELDRKPASLYYHVHALVKAGLVIDAGSRPAGTREERVYEAVARSIVVDASGKSRAYMEALADLASAALRQADRCHRAALLDADVRASGPDRQRSMLDMQVRLDDAALREVNRRLSELADFVYEHDQSSDGPFYSITVCMAPERS